MVGLPEGYSKHGARLAAFRSMEAVENNNKNEWVSLFAPDAVIEDPIGVSPLDPTGRGHRGIDKITEFYETVIGPTNVSFTIDNSYACGRECANVGTIATTMSDGLVVKTEGVFTYKINDDDQIVSLRAYWEIDNVILEMPSGRTDS